ncbi:MAG: UPF0175 family protein [Acidobacteria bacterium]|nr:MAG: UPF0175 family protein [Acidobacteriota bacterium]
MSALRLHVPDEALRFFDSDADHLAREIVLLAAVKLFELGKLSSGQAARLAGIPRVEFLARLRDYRVSPFQLTADELRRDVLNA